MSAAYTPDRRSLLCDSEVSRPVARSTLAGIGIAVLVHAGLALYIINERFEIIVPPAPPTAIISAPMITLDKPKPEPKPVEAQPVKQTPVKIHAPAEVSATVPDPLPVAPAHPDVNAGPVSGPVVSLSGQPSETSQSGKENGPVYARAVWSRFPDSDVLMRYYPPRALDSEVEGHATVSCEIIDTKGRVACSALSEAPAGYGFGRATVKAVEARGRADTGKGNLRIGDVMLIRLSWTLQ